MSNNPANIKEKFNLPANFQPMGSGVMKLEVPERDGYVRRWFRGEPGRVQRAIQAGYTFVDRNDVSLNNFDLGGDAKESGNTDMGSRVSVISGEGSDSTGQPLRMYLMECPEEIYEYSRSFVEARNESVADALRGGDQDGSEDETSSDKAQRYTRKKDNKLDLFTRKR